MRKSTLFRDIVRRPYCEQRAIYNGAHAGSPIPVRQFKEWSRSQATPYCLACAETAKRKRRVLIPLESQRSRLR